MILKLQRQEHTVSVSQIPSCLIHYTGTAVVKLSLLLFVFSIALLTITSCSNRHRKHLSEDKLKHFQSDNLRYHPETIRALVLDMASNDNRFRLVSKRVAEYYNDNNSFIWISLSGVKTNADSLLNIINKHCDDTGLRLSMFNIENIKKDIDIRSSPNAIKDINKSAAAVEYALTKALFLMASTQAYGLVNPDNIYNHIVKQILSLLG